MSEQTERDIYTEIAKNNVRMEHRNFSPYACFSLKGERQKQEEDRGSIRPVFFHDADRIIHTKAYTRYIDKTQVFFLFQNDHITHRVLHVQLVSKIARMIGRCLKLNEDLIEAIALGHDLGHVPYGHDGEKYLNEICMEKGLGCFCHNAQSVRSLMVFENDGKGLNLTLQVLDGILAHNGELLQERYEPDRTKTWDQFLSQYDKCWKVAGYDKKILPMTLEGCVVRISDVLSYIGRDIDDAVILNLIKRKDVPDEITEILGNNNRTIIDKLIRDLIVQSYGKPYISFSQDVYIALTALFRFNNENIYGNSKKMTENSKIKNMFRIMFETYLAQVNSKDQSSRIYGEHLKHMSTGYLENSTIAQMVIDYMAGMTDHFFNDQFQKLVIPQSYGTQLSDV